MLASMPEVGPVTIDVVLSELTLPGVDGPKLHAWLKTNQPQLAPKTLFVTAEPSAEEHRSFLESAKTPLLTKPVRRADLLAEVERLGRG